MRLNEVAFQLLFAGLHFGAILHAMAVAYHLKKAKDEINDAY